MPHKKSKKKSKKPKTYRKCEARVAPNCTGLYNPRTVKKDGICNRCYQHLMDTEQ
jgi:hypothetical protein